MSSIYSPAKLGFLSLPPEVRLMIYDHVFAEPTLQVDSDQVFNTQQTAVIEGASRNLLQTCKTIRSEATPYLEERTPVYLDQTLLERADFMPGTLEAIEAFTRKLNFIDEMWMCKARCYRLDISRFQQLRCLKFRIEAPSCCRQKIFGFSSNGEDPATFVQKHWLDDQTRAFGLFRRIKSIEVEPSAGQPRNGYYDVTFNLNQSKSGLRNAGRLLVNYARE